MMKTYFFGKYHPKMAFLALFFFVASSIIAQEKPEVATKVAKRYMQEAEEALAENDMATAEAYYRRAIAKDPANAEARYNLGNLYYNKEITPDAVERHGQAANVAEDKDIKHNSFHNRGNAFMKQKKYKEAVEAYKNALRNNPKDEETRYNLALAKKMLEEEQKDGGGGDQDQQDQDQSQDQNEENKDQEGDQGEKEQSEDGKPEDQEGGEQENQDQKEGQDQRDNEGEPQNQDKQENPQKQNEGQEQKQPQPRPGQLSPQQVKNLLEAMGNEEKKVQEKINAEKVKGAPTKTEKDW